MRDIGLHLAEMKLISVCFVEYSTLRIDDPESGGSMEPFFYRRTEAEVGVPDLGRQLRNRP
jgi:hypothetical protein